MTMKPAKPQHVVAIPYPAQGHITPMLQLCIQLVPHGFTFTFINSRHIHRRLLLAGSICPAPVHGQGADANGANACQVIPVHDHDIEAHEAVHHYKGCSSIRMVCVAGDCAPEKHAREATVMEAFLEAQRICEPVEHLLSHMMEEHVVDFILSDIFLGWSSATAQKFGMPWLGFWAASSASLSAFIYFSDLIGRGVTSLAIAEMEAEEAPRFLEGIPGLPPTRLCDVPKVWDGEGKLHVPMGEFFKAAMERAKWVVVNTLRDLEGQVIEALSQRFRSLYAVGPLLPSRYMQQQQQQQLSTCSAAILQEARPSLFPEDGRCLAWLDTQAPSSVLFISFGSISLRSHAQLHELAQGVHASGCPFLWVCKPDHEHTADNNGPNGFFSDEAGPPPHGLIVPWAPQLQVLSHPSIGGFITHCGWNSVIESVSMGVPMLCWADTSERMSNQRFVVEFWKCGIDMVADKRRAKQHIDEALLVGRDDIEKSIRFLMVEEGGASIRLHSRKLRAVAMEAYQDSHAQLNEFSQTMKERCRNLVDLVHDNSDAS